MGWSWSKPLVPLAGALLAAAALAAGSQEDPGERYRHAAAQAGLSPLRRDAYLEVAKLYQVRSRLVGPPGPDRSDPIGRLYNMGLDVLPVLVEALDDHTPSRTFHSTHSIAIAPTIPYPVSDIAGLAICAVADREFSYKGCSIQNISRVPENVSQFKKVVLDWYVANRTTPLAQRMIADVDDTDGENRCRAIEWLGRHKEAAGRDAIIERVNHILRPSPKGTERAAPRQPFGYLGASGELATAALALGKLGGSASEAAVKHVCNEFSRCVERDHLKGCDFGIDHLFTAYRGLIAIGRRDDAIKELERLFAQYSPEMSLNDRDAYKQKLATAQKWKGDDRDLIIH